MALAPYLFENLTLHEKKRCVIWKENENKVQIYLYKDIVNAAKTLFMLFKKIKVKKYTKIMVDLDHCPALLPVIVSIMNYGCCYCPIKLNEKNTEQSILRYKAKNVVCTIQLSIGFQKVEEIKLFDQTIYIYTFENEATVTQLKDDILFYAIKTSGSTGQPKIVNVPYKCISPNISSLSSIYNIKSIDVIFISSPPTFDPFIVDVFLALRNGAAILFTPKTVRLVPHILAPLLFEGNDDHCATICQITPSLFKRFNLNLLRDFVFTESTSLRILVLGGENFPPATEFRAWPLWNLSKNIQVFNIYGITEVSCWSSIEEITANTTTVSLGEPLEKDTMLIVRSTDPPFEIIHSGIGELSIESSVRKCFIDSENPSGVINEGPLARQTGDLVEVRKSKIYYKSRTNALVKRFGCRVSLKRIEEKMSAALSDIESICCILDPTNSALLAFIVLRKDASEPDSQSIFQFLDNSEIPDDIVFLQSFPLSCHGKISTRKLLEYYTSIVQKTATDIQENVIEMFKGKLAKYLGLNTYTTSPKENTGFSNKKPRINSWAELSFFDAGGTSFIALRILSELEDLACQPLGDFFVKLLDPSCPLQTVEDCLQQSLRYSNRALANDSHTNIPNGLNLKIAWKYDLKKCVDASPTIALTKEKIIVAVGSHSHKLACIDVRSGHKVSEIELPDRIESQVAVRDNVGIVGCYDGILYKFDVSTGNIIQTFDSHGMIKCRPLVLDNYIIFGNYYQGENICCLNYEKFKKSWSLRIGTKSCLASPIQENDETVTVCCLDGLISCIELKTGDIVWQHRMSSPIFSTPVKLTKNKIVVAEVKGNIYCFESGKPICNFATGASIFSSILKLDDMTVVFGCYDKFVYCLSLMESNAGFEQKWKILMNAQIYSAPTILRVNGANHIVVCTTKGDISIVEVERHCVVASIRLDGEVYSTPAAYGKRICVGCRDNYLYCIDIC